VLDYRFTPSSKLFSGTLVHLSFLIFSDPCGSLDWNAVFHLAGSLKRNAVFSYCGSLVFTAVFHQDGSFNRSAVFVKHDLLVSNAIFNDVGSFDSSAMFDEYDSLDPNDISMSLDRSHIVQYSWRKSRSGSMLFSVIGGSLRSSVVFTLLDSIFSDVIIGFVGSIHKVAVFYFCCFTQSVAVLSLVGSLPYSLFSL